MRLHHLAFRTGGVDALAEFYGGLFGWRVVRDRRPASLWLAVNEDAVAMIERRDADEPAPAPGSLDLVAFAVTASERERVRAEAERRGCFDGGTDDTVYLRDPDGRRIAVSTYPLAAAGDG